MLYFRNIWSITLIVLATTLLANAGREESRKSSWKESSNHSYKPSSEPSSKPSSDRNSKDSSKASSDRNSKDSSDRSSKHHSRRSSNHHSDRSSNHHPGRSLKDSSTSSSVRSLKDSSYHSAPPNTGRSLMDSSKSSSYHSASSSRMSSGMSSWDPSSKAGSEASSDRSWNHGSKRSSKTSMNPSSEGGWKPSWKPDPNVNLGPDTMGLALEAQQLVHAVLFERVDTSDKGFKSLVKKYMNSRNFINFFVEKAKKANDNQKQIIDAKLREKKIYSAFKNYPAMDVIRSALIPSSEGIMGGTGGMGRGCPGGSCPPIGPPGGYSGMGRSYGGYDDMDEYGGMGLGVLGELGANLLRSVGVLFGLLLDGIRGSNDEYDDFAEFGGQRGGYVRIGGGGSFPAIGPPPGMGGRGSFPAIGPPPGMGGVCPGGSCPAIGPPPGMGGACPGGFCGRPGN